MAKIKIKDLPKDMKISKDELKRIKGGAYEFYMESPISSIKWNVGNISPVITKKIQ